MTDTRSDNVISIAEWKARHQRNKHQPVDLLPRRARSQRQARLAIELIDRRPKLKLE